MYVLDTIIIDEEGPLPRYGDCGLFQIKALVDCKRWTTIHQKREADVENKKTIAETISAVQGSKIETVVVFKYLVRIMSNIDSDEPTVNRNRKRARTTKGRIGAIVSP
jgi:hypothetical protein